ncbi:Sec-independent protein translocase subunit TatA [Streptomyces sp. NPDC002225]|uniref:Sec-independent protein translocase subunit TatA n=1 Tax=Streptomyces sp. NPDC002225 TaxID=3154413 RepID=UPI0033322736
MLRNGLEPWHLLIVAIVVIVLFGSKKLPDTARALGKSMRILKSEAKAMKETDTPRPGADAQAPHAEPQTARTGAQVIGGTTAPHTDPRTARTEPTA